MIDGFYDRYMYTPMPETYNEMVPVTVGCSYGKCIYCDLNVGKKFKVFGIEDVKKYIRDRKDLYEDKRLTPKKFTLLEGNALCLKDDYLKETLKEMKKNSPNMKYVSYSSRSDDILRKTDNELSELKNLGLDRICVGIKLGSDWVFSYHKKGVAPREQLMTPHRFGNLGIKYSVYIMLGSGGEAHSREHIMKTAEFLNKVNPFEIVVANLILFKNAKLVENVRSHDLKRVSIREQIIEEIMLAENLNKRCIYNGAHKTKAVAVASVIPDKKDGIIAVLKQRLEDDDKEMNKKGRKKWDRWDGGQWIWKKLRNKLE